MLALLRTSSEEDLDHEKAGNQWPSEPPFRIRLESLVVLTTWLLGQVLTGVEAGTEWVAMKPGVWSEP